MLPIVNRPVTAPPQFDPPRDIAIHPAPLNFAQPADEVILNEAGDGEDPEFRERPLGDALRFTAANDLQLSAPVIAPHAPRPGGGYSGRTGGRRTLRAAG